MQTHPPPLRSRRPAFCWPYVAALVLLVVAISETGCTGEKFLALRKRPFNPLEQQLNFVSGKGPQPTDRTRQFLRRFDLLKPYDRDPANALVQLHEEIAREASAEKIYAFSELAYVQGQKAESIYKTDIALDLYGASVAHAYWFLLDPEFDRFRNPYDPQFRRACDLYNGALEASLRIVKKQGRLLPGKSMEIETGSQKFNVTVVCRGPWKAEEIERLEFVNDFDVEGLVNHYHTYGLGVPMIAVRKAPSKLERAERYYPAELSFAVTAFLRVMDDPKTGTAHDGQTKQCVLELYDPLSATNIEVCNREVPLETDLSTPLAYYLNSPALREKNIATLGLLDANKAATFKGLYMVEPYDPEKIPVIMVHGLWSSPLTWMEMFNDLRALPEIRERYQFWFYLYPTGQPFWTSAASMRHDLAEMRQTLDPTQENRALNQMVLVGHSMGGLVSRLQTFESGDQYWQVVSEKPFDTLEATDEERQAIGNVCYFHANASVKRVITIGTPHRGSNFANFYTRYAGQWLISLPQMMVQINNSVVRKNPDYFRNTALLTTTTSIDSLAPDSPIFPVYLQSQKRPGVHYHNIVGEVPHHGIVGYVSRGSDGIVPFSSAHMEDVESEIVVTADHTSVHRHPRSVLEVRRILLEHTQSVLAEWQAETADDKIVQPASYHTEG
ncbi:MAG TPA: alpha/beta fold hydrolase [Pirellulaceae bacterium]|nr:alpha/beta fold hydrolase [Pirellulaceae bacterium]